MISSFSSTGGRRRRPGAVTLVIGILLASSAVEARGREPGSIVSVEPVQRWSVSDIEEAGPSLFEWYGTPDAQYPVEEFIVYYHTTDFDGTAVEAKSRLFVPVLPEEQEQPVLVFGSGTTGIADRCAPSLEQPEVERWGYYRTNMASYAAQGIITIFPDYIGFNDRMRAQRYFSKAAEGHLLLDGARAVKAFFADRDFAVGPADQVFTAGYSQGGHAALAAADLRDEYAPDVPLRGAIGFAATNDVATLMREAAYYSPYIIYAYRAMYGFDEIDPADYLQERWVETLTADIATKCVKEMELYFPFDGRELFTPEFYEALHGGTLAEEYPALHRRLVENRSGLSGHDVPVLIVQGGNDIIITTPSIRRYISRLCETDVPVTYRFYEDARHRHTRPAGFRASVEWIKAIAAGEEPPNECGAF
jgi:acetyl esterase/lipase